VQTWDILWRPEAMSASFHGRDLLAPVAGQLARGVFPSEPPRSGEFSRCADWPDDLAEIVYVDRYGNAITGLRAAVLLDTTHLRVSGRVLPRARTFSDVPPGTAFWYENSNGLAEIAVNAGRADAVLGLAIGSPVATRP
jgi:S-adenosyl-L-methionine hydrolase (adenosine-forming)